MTSRRQAHPDLLECWSRVRKRIVDAPRIALFLDFDGTLVAYASKPELVRLVPATRRILQRLARNPRVRISIVSGRRRARLVHYVALPRLNYLGAYGWETSARSGISPLDRAALAKARVELAPILKRDPAAWLQDKQFLLAVHFRKARPGARRRLRAAIYAIAKSSRGRLRVLENRGDCELVPREFRGKGHAVRAEIARAADARTLPIFFGDDYSDEPAFIALRRGITVCVGRGDEPTRARFTLRSPADVATALGAIEEALK